MSISRRSFVARGLGYAGLLFPVASSLLAERPGDRGRTGKPSPSPSSDEKTLGFFKDVLKDELHPDLLEYRQDGRFEMSYDFNRKNSKQAGVFTRKIGKSTRSPFRWTLREEDCLRYHVPGLRIADKGSALLRVWWEDDVEVEVNFRQQVTMSPRNVFAVVFNNKSNAAVGSNYGSQCALFSRGRLLKRTREKIRGVNFNQSNSIGLRVRSGQFAACRDGVVSSRGSYPEKKFQSGRVGFFWGGSLAGVIESLKITGRIDYERTLEGLKKRK